MDSKELLTITPLVMAELDYLIATRNGVSTELKVLRELASGAWEIADINAGDIRRAVSLIEKYRKNNIGLTDALNVVVARNTSTRAIVTLDHRHFRVIRDEQGMYLEVLP
jgi:predicted nucleic acid-binding protein